MGVALVTMLACLFVPRRRAGLWIGLLTVIGAPTLRMHGVLFAIPAMLEVRREIALLAAILVATYTFEGMWLGLALVTIANLLARQVSGAPRAGRHAGDRRRPALLSRPRRSPFVPPCRGRTRC